MFYPVESLKRGGKFYLCWVADSWPLRFATLTQKQLWSQDIRKLWYGILYCQDGCSNLVYIYIYLVYCQNVLDLKCCLYNVASVFCDSQRRFD